MEKTSRIIKNVEKLFPEHQINLKRRFETVHSEIFIMELIRSKNDTPQRVLVKFCGSNNSVEVLNEFRNLSIFNKECKDKRILSPKPLRVDPKNGMIVMEYIEGTSLKQLLLKLKPGNKEYLSKIVDLSAIALSKFHYIFRKTEYENILIDSPLLRDDVNTDINNNVLLSQCNLKIRVKSFIDFAVWNLISHNIEPKIFLIDFPEKECICTPHLDLARFKFSLEIIKQYPQFRFLKINWWNIDSMYNNFLERYCKEMKVNLNEQDMALINYFMKEYVRKTKNIYADNKSSIRFKLERLYLRRFIETSSNQNERRR
jgi:RIO-like serine/threonine protein kinase